LEQLFLCHEKGLSPETIKKQEWLSHTDVVADHYDGAVLGDIFHAVYFTANYGKSNYFGSRLSCIIYKIKTFHNI
jgi:hypothetical protein